MKRFDYRIERIEFERGTQRDERILAVLDRPGGEGWHEASPQVEPRIATNEPGLKVLLEMEAGGEQVPAVGLLARKRGLGVVGLIVARAELRCAGGRAGSYGEVGTEG